MEEYLKVYERECDGWKYVTIPKKSKIKKGDIVIIRSVTESE